MTENETPHETTPTGADDTSARNAPKPPLTPEQDERWAIVAHLGGVIGFLPALLIYATLGERGDATRDEATEALNFQLSVGVPAIVLYIISGIITGIPVVGWVIGVTFWALAGLLLAAGAIFSIIGAVHTWRRGTYQYPWAVRLVGQ